MSLKESEGNAAPVQIEQSDEVPVKRRTFGQKVKRSCVRFWWLYFLIFAAVVLIIVLPIIYVGYPNLAQDAINDSSLNITSMTISDPSPDSFNLELDTVLHTDSGNHPDLRSWNASLRLAEDAPAFAYIQIPPVKAREGALIHIDQRVQIANMTEFTNYVAMTLGTQEFPIYLKGHGNLKLGGLPTIRVDYNKEIITQGLNRLAGFNVTNFNILTSQQPDGANANGTLFIPNPTNTTVELGTVTLSMSVDETPIGQATIGDMTLVPGDNNFDMRAVTNQSAVLGLILGQYQSGILPIDVVGNATFNSQNQTLLYYQIPLQHNVLSFDLNVMDALQRAGLADLLGLNSTTTSTKRLL